MRYYTWDKAFPSQAARTSKQAVRRGASRHSTAQEPAERCISVASLSWHPLPVLVWDPSRGSSSRLRPVLKSSQGAAQKGSSVYSVPALILDGVSIG